MRLLATMKRDRTCLLVTGFLAAAVMFCVYQLYRAWESGTLYYLPLEKTVSYENSPEEFVFLVVLHAVLAVLWGGIAAFILLHWRAMSDALQKIEWSPFNRTIRKPTGRDG